MTLGTRIIVGLRCSLRLETPVAAEGRVLVPEAYLATLVDACNAKQRANWQRIDRLHALLPQGQPPAAGGPTRGPLPAGVASQTESQTVLRRKQGPAKEAPRLKWAPLFTTATSSVGAGGNPSAWLRRWAHTVCVWGSCRLVVCGGYGGLGAHSRLADVVVVDVQANTAVRLAGPSGA